MSYINQYKILHEQEKNYGTSNLIYFKEICLVIDYLSPKTVVDFGCGKGKLTDALQIKYPDIKFYKYDPAIKDYEILPVEKADLVINTDVLEHIPEEKLPEVIQKISSISENAFYGLNHAKAIQILPNGQNVHCTVKPQLWYYNFLLKFYKLIYPLKGKSNELSVIITFEPTVDFLNKYDRIVNNYIKRKNNKIFCLLERIIQRIFS